MTEAMTKGVMLVTGASRGIGAATARRAAQAGYAVAITYLERAAVADQLVAELHAAGTAAIAVQADVGDAADVERLFRTVDDFGRLEVLVNNAGITGGPSRVAALDASILERVVRTNVIGSILCAQAAVRRLSSKHGGSGGAIVNLSSIAARMGSPGVWVHYAATKGAIDTFTIGLAKEVAREGIRVNAVRAGLIDTEIQASREPGQMAAMIKAIPIGRIGRPDEIAATILWLASPEASYVSGALLEVGGAV